MSPSTHISFLRSHILFGLVFSLFFDVTMATSCSQNPTFCPEKPVGMVVTKKKDSRRRDGCDDSPSIWTVNLCQSNTFCYVTTEQIDLWLPKNQRSGQRNDRMVIKNTVSQSVVIEVWPASKETLVWPLKKMPIQSGVTYSIGIKEGRDYPLEKIVLHQIPANLSVEEQIVEMRRKGCSQQADKLTVEKFGSLQK